MYRGNAGAHRTQTCAEINRQISQFWPDYRKKNIITPIFTDGRGTFHSVSFLNTESTVMHFYLSAKSVDLGLALVAYLPGMK